MKIWQAAMCPDEIFYRMDTNSKSYDGAANKLALYRNRGKMNELLLAYPAAIAEARLACKGEENATKELDAFERIVLRQREEIRKGKRLWQSIFSKGGTEDKFLNWLSSVDERMTFLPNWMIWGEHRTFDGEHLSQIAPKTVELVRINDSNDWMLAANIDYGSFNMRVAKFIRWAVGKGKVDNDSIRLFSDTIAKFADEPGFDISKNGTTKRFDDFDGDCPALVSILHASILIRKNAEKSEHDIKNGETRRKTV